MNRKLFYLIAIILFFGCKEKFTPKPRGFFRISFPSKEYKLIGEQYPYQFYIPDYAGIVPDTKNPDQPWWINLEFQENRAELHISYYNLTQSQKNPRRLLGELIEETRELAYKHSVKANAIEERLFLNLNNEVFGTIYQIEGNAASPIQFFLTDSTRNFLRGALYIRATPDIDSLKPVIDFLKHDVIQLIESAKWKE